jgi:aryl-alcohol dehydrogenase-like predicted oxidoreductase
VTSRLGLGTAQLAMPYGIASSGVPPEASAAATLVSRARAAGMDTLDTAIAYGASERVLGSIGVDSWRVVTKLPAVPAGCDDIERWVEESVRGSLERLRISGLYALLLHRCGDLLHDRGAHLHAALVALKARGIVRKIGVSIYGPQELSEAFSRFELDIVQAPFNVLDRRLQTSGWLHRLHGSGVEVHVRSAFLQGLLLMPGDRRPPQFAKWRPLWIEWDAWLRERGLDALRGCLGFVLANEEIDRVIVGVDHAEQLTEILDASMCPPLVPPETLCSEDLDLINPARWNAS